MQFGRINIEKAKKDSHIEQEEEEELTNEEIHTPNNNDLKNKVLNSTNGFKKQNNGYVPNGNLVISRDDKLILVPEPLGIMPNPGEELGIDEIKVNYLRYFKRFFLNQPKCNTSDYFRYNWILWKRFRRLQFSIFLQLYFINFITIICCLT